MEKIKCLNYAESSIPYKYLRIQNPRPHQKNAELKFANLY